MKRRDFIRQTAGAAAMAALPAAAVLGAARPQPGPSIAYAANRQGTSVLNHDAITLEQIRATVRGLKSEAPHDDLYVLAPPGLIDDVRALPETRGVKALRGDRHWMAFTGYRA